MIAMTLLSAQVFLLITSIICFTNTAVGQFASPPEGDTIYKKEYRTIEITWTFTLPGKFTIKWFFTERGSSGDKKPIYFVTSEGEGSFISSQNQLTNERLGSKVNLNGEKKDATLVIKDFTKRDEGVFTCEVAGTSTYERSVNVRAVVLSNVTAFKTLGNRNETVQGDNITLSCTATVGQPSPKLEIQNVNGNKALNSTKVNDTANTTLLYHFGQISKEDSGTYSCRATTERYTSEKSLELRVEYPPEIDKSAVKSEQFGCRGKLMTIVCEASGDPKPEIRIIDPDGKRLTGNEFILEKFGIYKCQASSRLGNDSVNITVSEAKDRPDIPSFSDECSFDKLTWQKSSDKSIQYTLQVRKEGSAGAWGDIITSIDTTYSPSTNKTLSKFENYEFRVVATNCVGKTESEKCIVKGQPESGERSSDGNNAGVIAGSVIAVLVVILVIVIVAVCWRKKRRESPTVRMVKKSPAEPVGKKTPNQGTLLYSDSPNMDTTHVRPPVEYRQDDDDDFDDDDEYDHGQNENGPTLSNNVPSWV